jgi:hypothetical protein
LTLAVVGRGRGLWPADPRYDDRRRIAGGGLMDVYHIWCSLKRDVGDLEFALAARSYLEHLKSAGMISGFRVTRRKLGLAPTHLPEWHITLDFDNLAQLDNAFNHVSSRADPAESFHHAVNSKVDSVFFALYRDFPDPGRVTGQEKF